MYDWFWTQSRRLSFLGPLTLAYTRCEVVPIVHRPVHPPEWVNPGKHILPSTSRPTFFAEVLSGQARTSGLAQQSASTECHKSGAMWDRVRERFISDLRKRAETDESGFSAALCQIYDSIFRTYPSSCASSERPLTVHPQRTCP